MTSNENVATGEREGQGAPDSRPAPTQTPLQKMIDTLWHSPPSRMGTKDILTEAVEFCVEQYGLIDRLTPGGVVLRHNDPRVKGELRVKLAKADIVLVLVFFKEAPSAKVAVEVPTKEWKDGMEQKIIPRALPGVFQLLMNKAREELTDEEKRAKPQILLPG